MRKCPKPINPNYSVAATSLPRGGYGFSLVELMIVIILIGVLAAIAAPIYSSQVLKAKMTEADTALGSLRSQLRTYYGEHGVYPTSASATPVVGATWNHVRNGELNGKYFVDSSYSYRSADGSDYILTCSAGSLLDSDRTLDFYGNLSGGN